MTRSKRSTSVKQRRNKRHTTRPPKRKQSSESTKSNVATTTKRHRKSTVYGCACYKRNKNKTGPVNRPQKEVTTTDTAVATADSSSTIHVNDEDEDELVPDFVDVESSSGEEDTDEDDSDDGDDGSDDMGQLHGPCGLKPARSDLNDWECLIRKPITKEFLTAYGDLMEFAVHW